MRTAFLTASALLLAGCSHQRTSLPVYGHVTPFVLTSQTGQEFASDALKGKVWVADFIFTSCQGPCPLMTRTMRRVQKQTAGVPDVQMVSFTVDPNTDTPPVLADYAGRFDADTSRWVFLTGPMAALHQVGRYTFKVTDVNGNRSHSIRFILVDKRGDIRGYFDSREEGELAKLVAAIRALARERS